MIIGLSGWARSGKSAVADILVEKHGFRKKAFADSLRDALYVLDPIVEDGVTLKEVIDHFGWEGYKDTKFYDEIRGLMQRLGTDVGRDILHDDIWVDATFARIKQGERIVIQDCRFTNEVQAIRERGGKIVRITRTGVDAANEHISEHDLDEYSFDYHLNNSGSLADFRNSVARFANEFKL